ncbi:MAG TPA: hypothetical protein VJ302_22370, partial [Blastocatellia bacterium]|nr:hypothetical protein [Blastocatellia bacterium]
FNGYDIYIHAYSSRMMGRSPTIDQLADQMRLGFDHHRILDHQKIIFLCHSMGGLVTRSYLVKYREQVASKIGFLYFFSTPTSGSDMARIAQLLSRNRQIGNMLPMEDGYLANLKSQWLAAGLGNLPSFCGYETLETYGLLIVGFSSANDLCNRRLDPITADHLSIVKPADSNSSSYSAFKSAFLEMDPAPEH